MSHRLSKQALKITVVINLISPYEGKLFVHCMYVKANGVLYSII